MNKTTYLLICLIEECAEIIWRSCKTIRFGLLERQPGQDFSNITRLRMELVDLDVIRLKLNFEDSRFQTYSRECDDWKDQKSAKVEKYMGYSMTLGILEKDGRRLLKGAPTVRRRKARKVNQS